MKDKNAIDKATEWLVMMFTNVYFLLVWTVIMIYWYFSNLPNTVLMDILNFLSFYLTIMVLVVQREQSKRLRYRMRKLDKEKLVLLKDIKSMIVKFHKERIEDEKEEA